MLSSFILYLLMFVVLSITGFIVVFKTDEPCLGVISTLVGIISAVAVICLIFAGGCGGEFGFNTYREVPTTNFSKALLSDHSGVVIRYPATDGQYYTFNQFNVVHNYYTITNILICERRSLFGNQTEFNIKIITPPYQEE